VTPSEPSKAGPKGDPLARLGPDLLPPDTKRPHQQRGPSVTIPLVVVGGFFVAIAFSSTLATKIDEQVGLLRCYAAGLALLCLITVRLFRAQARTHERLLDFTEEVLKLSYGPNFRREREAVDILVRALDSEQETVRATSMSHLERLTGQRFQDARAWRDWWAEHRKTFSTQRKERKP
jgi:hypothetical protein